MSIADADSRIVRAGDATFSYLEAGSGPALVLLHGIGSAAASFRHQLEALSARFRVVAWDAPGYGASTPFAIDRMSMAMPSATSMTNSESMIRVFATLRFAGDALDPDEISDVVKERPTKAHRKGEIYRPSPRKSRGYRQDRDLVFQHKTKNSEQRSFRSFKCSGETYFTVWRSGWPP